MKQVLLLLLISLVLAGALFADSVITEGGNVTDINLTANRTTRYWVGIVGNMNISNPANPLYPIGYLNAGDVDIYEESPNGSYYHISMIVTRLDTRPNPLYISSPTLADISTGGMFSNFTAFKGLNFTTFPDSPFYTFVLSRTTNCTIGSYTYLCPYITLNPGVKMGLLKYSNGTHEEPLFVIIIENQLGYNGSYFDFEYMVPKNESYYFYVYADLIENVSLPVPPTPSRPRGGPGGPHIGIPVAVTPPPSDKFDINPKNINIIVDYPKEGKADFTLYSLNRLTDVYCYVTADFAEYVTIDIDESIPAGGTIHGTITVNMPPTVILDYNKGLEGLLQCVGRKEQNSTLWFYTSANIYLTLNRPEIEVEGIGVEIFRGTSKNLTLTLTNIGNGTAYVFNLSAEFTGSHAHLAQITSIPPIILHGESGTLFFTLDIPAGMEPGVYKIPILIYENGRLVGQGYVIVFVREEVAPPRCICIFPDLRWTVIILVAGILAAVFLFKREKYKLEEKDKLEEKNKLEKWDSVKKTYPKEKEDERKWLKPYKYALVAFFASFILWALIVWILARCTYI